jgi:predicted membrane channel-forming protein YqfA (hemolysin III family)
MASLLALARLHKLIWVLIYGGLLTLVLGISVGRTDSVLGWTLMLAGGAIAAVGVLLVWVRSRLTEDTP